MTILLDNRFEIKAIDLPDGWKWKLYDRQTTRFYSHKESEQTQLDVVRAAVNLIDEWLRLDNHLNVLKAKNKEQIQ